MSIDACSWELPLTAGTAVADLTEAEVGTLLGITQALGIVRFGTSIQVLPWQHIAIANVSPSPETLSSTMREKDHRNAAARALSELLLLSEFELTSKQHACLHELLTLLTVKS